jgi:hypothetical protein
MLQGTESGLCLPDQGLEERLLDTRRDGFSERGVQKLVDLQEERDVSGVWRYLPWRKRCPRCLEETGTTGGILNCEEFHEAQRFLKCEGCRLHRKHGLDLLLGGKSRKRACDGDSEKVFGKKALDLGRKPPENLQPVIHPRASFPKSPEKGMAGQPVVFVEVGQDLELFPERGLA